MPELRRLLLAGAVVAAFAASALHASAGDDSLAKGRAAIARSDGLGAEIAYKGALAAGAPREAVAAGMGEALLLEGKPGEARKWLASGQFAAGDTNRGWRALSRLEAGEGNFAEADAALAKALAASPEDADTVVDLAQLRYRSGRQVEAIETVDRALTLDKDNIRALDFRGLIVRDQFGPAAALPWFEAGLYNAPADPGLLGDYAAALGDAGRMREMLAVTRRMLELGADPRRALFFQAVLAARAGNHSLARAMLNKAGDPIRTPAGLMLDAVLDIEAGNANLAVNLLEELVRRQPHDEPAQLLLARAIYEAGESEQVVSRFAALAGREGASPYLLTIVARAYEDLGRRQDAAPLLDRAATVAKAGLQPVADMTSFGDAANRYQAFPGDVEAAAGQVRALIALGRAGDALGLADKVRGEHPGLAATALLLGDARFAAGQFDGALAAYGEAAKIRFDDPLLTRMILAQVQAGRRDAASQLGLGYFAARPESRVGARIGADYAASLADWDKARALLGPLRDSGGERDLRLLTDLAFAQLRAGDPVAAESTAGAALRLQPMNPLAADVLAMVLQVRGEKGPVTPVLAAKASAVTR